MERKKKKNYISRALCCVMYIDLMYITYQLSKGKGLATRALTFELNLFCYAPRSWFQGASVEHSSSGERKAHFSSDCQLLGD